MRKRLLYFTNNDSGRDVEMILPVLYFAERFLDCDVTTTLTPNLHEIFRLKPDCVILGNTIGAKLHFHIARAARRAGIPVFALVSEGNFPTDGTFNYWGYNTSRELLESYLCCWSQRTRRFLLEELPELNHRIVLTGGVGFDRYRIYEFPDRRSFLERHGISPDNFTRFIGYAGWGFGKLRHERGRRELLQFFKGDASKLQWAEEQRRAMEEILRKSVEAHPETLFIFKKHPTETVAAEGFADHNEMASLKHHPNVLYLIDEKVDEIIHAVDLWWVYESTTSIEAAMLGKQILFIVPDGDFPRTPLHTGFPEGTSFREVEELTQQFFQSGSLPAYNSEELTNRRNELIENTIGWSDGYNHLRAAYYLERTLSEPPPPKVGGISLYYLLAYYIVKFFAAPGRIRLLSRIPYLSRKRWVLERYHLSRLPRFKQQYQQHLDRFYRREGIEDRLKSGTLFSSIFRNPNSHSIHYEPE